ncbi:acyl-CoA thioester hydrolase [Melghirimyces thermohalophilus]|uniref:Acyl-CoA thioester hydrolase n=1 Tax=Melghirimyces thermohalophilus TaxID=1236220 RepID=A0A1G6K4M8_9BACL|nr:thioesterase family protein [Melghirimyces thermohalophilus]SDC25838.1 acyl-CoA thioester hydrolase [Melghirimyces thermohalophilus]
MPLTTQLQVRFNECDGLGHVNNAVYYTYMETARIELFQMLDPEMNLNNWKLIVASTSCEYKSQASFAQWLKVSTEVERIGTSSFTILHQINDLKTDELIAVGRAVLVHYDYQKQRSVPLTRDMKKTLQSLHLPQ